MKTTKILEFKLRSVGLSESESFVTVYSFTLGWILNLELAVNNVDLAIPKGLK